MIDQNSRINLVPLFVACVVVFLVTVAVLAYHGDPTDHSSGLLVSSTALDFSSDNDGNSTSDSNSARGAGSLTNFKTTIRRPSGPPTIALNQIDPQGRTGSVACSTCHSVREPDFTNRVPADLEQFHQNMPMAHGKLTCYSCHNPTNADTLQLADTTTVEYPDVMTLCAQCHGPQARDYEHGAHGGMTGYWDLSRGPRTRNNCIDCHDPHVPAYPRMQPTFKPRDRFLNPPNEASHE